MSMLDILYFGQVDPEKPESVYRGVTALNEQDVKLDLHFDQPQVAPALAETINTFLQAIPSFDQANHAAIREDYASDGEALDYIRIYLDEFRDRDLMRILGGKEENKSIPNRLLDKLRLVRIGLYPDDADGFLAVFDYSIEVNGKPYHQVLAISTDEQGAVEDIACES